MFLLGYSLDRHAYRLDLSGLLLLEESTSTSLRARVSDYGEGFSLTTRSDMPKALKTFRWEGIRWTPLMLQCRLTWFGVALLAVLLATVCFDRFDHARGRRARPATAAASAGR